MGIDKTDGLELVIETPKPVNQKKDSKVKKIDEINIPADKKAEIMGLLKWIDKLETGEAGRYTPARLATALTKNKAELAEAAKGLTVEQMDYIKAERERTKQRTKEEYKSSSSAVDVALKLESVESRKERIKKELEESLIKLRQQEKETKDNLKYVYRFS